MKVIGIRRKSDGEILMAVPLGTRYHLPPGVTLDQVETVIITTYEDIVMTKEQMETANQTIEQNEKLEKIARHFGMDMADFIEQVAAALGIPHCKVCEMRKNIMYKIHEIGWWKAMALIWKTIKKRELSEEEKHLIG